MNLTRTSILGVLLVLALAVVPVQAQVTLTSTTLSTAVTSKTTNTITVTSATGFSVGRIAYTGREAMRIQAVSGTTITVRRGSDSTRAYTHASGATIYVGPVEYFSTYDRSGSCTAANELVLPVINLKSGTIWNCVSSVWTATNGPATQGTGLTSLGPATANTTDVGSALLPFRKLYLGTAATNNFVHTPAATGAARIITWADPGGAATVAYTNPTTAQTVTNTYLNSSINITTADLGTVRVLRGEITATGAGSAATAGTVTGVRGAVTVANGTSVGSGVYLYGTQGKLITGTGTLALGSGMGFGVFGQLDVTGGTLTSGHIAAVGGDIFGLNSGSCASCDLVYAQSAGGGVANAMFKAFGKTTYVFDLESNVHTQMGTTGEATTAAGWLKVLVDGNVRYINLFSTAP